VPNIHRQILGMVGTLRFAHRTTLMVLMDEFPGMFELVEPKRAGVS
jgi:hypothetical protein